MIVRNSLNHPVRRLSLLFTGSVILLWLGLVLAPAQNYQQEKPKTLPHTASPAVAPESKVQTPTDNQEVIVEKLRAVVFVDSLDQVQEEPRITDGVITNKIPLLQHPGLDAVIKPYLAGTFTMARLQSLVRDVIIWCRDQDHPVVDIVVPQQDITEGVLQLIFIEGRVGEVRVQGNRWFSTENLRSNIRLKKNDYITASDLEADVNWANQNPFHSSTILFTPSEETGHTDIVLDTKDRFPFRPYVGYENSGGETTGQDRYLGGFNWGDAFFVGHQLNYQYMASGNNYSLKAHALSYVAPLPWRHTLTLFGALSQSRAHIEDFSIKGSGSQVGTRYDIPLPGVPNTYEQTVELGFDWKQSDNSLEFGTIPVNAGTVDVRQMVFGYQGRIIDPLGYTLINPQLFWSPGETGRYQTATDLTATRPGASSNYLYMRLGASRTTRLPWDFSLVNEIQWQITNRNLLPSEQLGFGGGQSIRGYNEWDISGTDEGWISRNELRLPPVSFGQLMGIKAIQDQLQFLAFFDYGQAWSYNGPITLNNGIATETVTMASVGPGVRYTINTYFTLRADYGFQLRDTGDREASRAALSAVLSY